MKKEHLRSLPSVDALLKDPSFKGLISGYGRGEAVKAARKALAESRREMMGGRQLTVTAGFLGAKAGSYLEQRHRPSLRNAVNATGILIHTGLGRAVLPPSAAEAVADVIKGYCNLAVDAGTGQRAERETNICGLLCELTGAEDAAVVSNNAFATMLILNSLAKGKEVIVSRGQLVEIGGSFRMPEVMKASGAVIREIGTTNKTHLKDYANAVNKNTGAILHVHHSNYKIIGFAEEPGIAELVKAGRKHKVPVIDDLGSGALVDLGRFGLAAEPMVRDSVKAGADAVCFSGDKLIGGPQCGIIVGKKKALVNIKKNQLARAFRIDKMTVAALEAVLKLFLDPDRLAAEHPLYRMLSTGADEIGQRERRVMDTLASSAAGAEIKVIDGESYVGSGSAPEEALQTKLLSVRPGSPGAGELARKLRMHEPPIFARIYKDALLFDFRTVFECEDRTVAEALAGILSGKGD